MPNVFLEIYLVLGKLGRGQEFARQSNQSHSPDTQIIHLTGILVEHLGKRLQTVRREVFKMKSQDKIETHGSAINELAAPVMFIAALFALVALVSLLG